MFDFNILVDAYREDRLDRAREYLYDNIMALVTKELMAGINGGLHEDIVQELFLKIDEWILLSISKGYGIKQIYSYIKLRVSGFIINYYKFEVGKNYIETNYVSDDDWIEVEQQLSKQTINKNILHKLPGLMIEAMQYCTEDEKKIINFIYVGLDFDRINNILDRDDGKLKKIISSATKKVRLYLQNKGLQHEDLC